MPIYALAFMLFLDPKMPKHMLTYKAVAKTWASWGYLDVSPARGAPGLLAPALLEWMRKDTKTTSLPHLDHMWRRCGVAAPHKMSLPYTMWLMQHLNHIAFSVLQLLKYQMLK